MYGIRSLLPGSGLGAGMLGDFSSNALLSEHSLNTPPSDILPLHPMHYNYKHRFSIVLLAVVDADDKFIYVENDPLLAGGLIIMCFPSIAPMQLCRFHCLLNYCAMYSICVEGTRNVEINFLIFFPFILCRI